MNNVDIARVFSEIADILEIKGRNEFRIRSYRQAEQTLFDLTVPVEEMLENGEDITSLPGIGDSHAKKIKELVKTGRCSRLEELREDFPKELTVLMKVPGLGAKKVALLHRELGIKNLKELEKAAREKRIQNLEGMGAKSEEKILKGVATLKTTAGRISIKEASDKFKELDKYLSDIEEIQVKQVAGSLRRSKDTIGDLDVLIITEDRKEAIKRIREYPQIEEISAEGEEKLFVKLTGGMEVDFRFFEKKSFGAALMYFTGSKAHNVELRKLAQAAGWKLNEYGVFDGKKKLAGEKEREVYNKLGMDWVPPELRENRGEIAAAKNGKLPTLIEVGDIRGDLHVHTTASDGSATIEEMTAAAIERGYQYLAITDHSQAVRVTQGLDEEGLAEHVQNVRAVDGKHDNIRVLAGVEVDILKDGRLDLSTDILGELDWVIASIHSYFNLEKKEMTKRLITAIESGAVNCLGHPLGRLLGTRDAVDFDVNKVFDACLKNEVILEINAHPQRLDLPDTYCKLAKDKGIKMVISSDAHKTRSLDLIGFGVGVARRGWLDKDDVINTLEAKELIRKVSKVSD